MRGFTLIEMLVVLALMGMLAALVGPNVQTLVGRIEHATQRQSLLSDIASLPYRGYSSGEKIVLENDKFSTVLRDGNPVLAVPKGWRVVVKRPIEFSFNGFCSGGVIELTGPDSVVEHLLLEPPACRVVSDADQN